MDALGMIECSSFPAVVEASDIMLKTTNIQLIALEKTGGGCVTALIRGPLEAVRTAVELGVQAAEKVGEVLSLHVIQDAHPDLYPHLYPKGPLPRD